MFQFFLQTPPASEDEEEYVKEPREIASIVKSKTEPVATKSIELDDSIITKNLFEFVAEEKRKFSFNKYLAFLILTESKFDRIAALLEDLELS